ncbi:MAG: transcription factor [Candidatus Odinarchaeota archaeon]
MNSVTKDKRFNSIIEDLDGEIDMNVVGLLKDDEEVTDEYISQKTGLKLNIVRKVLYKLYDTHVASYRRERDKNTGWYIYYWRLNPAKIYDVVYRRKISVLKLLEERLKYEREHQFYQCEKDENIRLTFEEAMEAMFKCPHCNGQLVFKDNKKLISSLSAKIDELKRGL